MQRAPQSPPPPTDRALAPPPSGPHHGVPHVAPRPVVPLQPVVVIAAQDVVPETRRRVVPVEHRYHLRHHRHPDGARAPQGRGRGGEAVVVVVQR